MVCHIEEMCTKFEDETLAVRMADVGEKALKKQEAKLIVVVQLKAEAIFNATKAAELYRRDNFIAVKVTHAKEQRSALVRIGMSIRNDAL